jgi:hypothetical protein
MRVRAAELLIGNRVVSSKEPRLMPAFRVSLRIILIGILCLGIFTLHGTAAAPFHSGRHCSSFTQPAQVSSDITSPSSGWTESLCCSILVDSVLVARTHPESLRNPLGVKAKPFLLVRTLSPPPKSPVLLV